MSTAEVESIPPKDLNHQEDNNSQTVLGSIPILSMLVVNELFSNAIVKDDEYLFLSSTLTSNSVFQNKLIDQLSELFRNNGSDTPKRWIFQVFHRKAGSTPFINDNLGQYCAALCLRDSQVVIFDHQEYLLSFGMISPIFQLKKGSRPFVPKNRTQIRVGYNQVTLKPRKYLCFLVWAFWDEYPIQNTEHSDSLVTISNEQESKLNSVDHCII